ncbi:MAG: hypothetical protein R2942_17335 [Ignavibacteria bacterium]
MSTNKSASMEARLKNNKDLVISIKEYTRYQPTSEEIKKENYETFLANAESAMTELKNSIGSLSTEKKQCNDLFESLMNTARYIRSEIGELKGTGSNEYELVNPIVKLITGENVSQHSAKRKKMIKNLNEGEEGSGGSSVSQLDRKSMLGNFRLLLGSLRSFNFYDPDDETLKLNALETFETELTASLERVAEKETAYINKRSRIIQYFDDKGGLRDRAKRAKMHVRRKYGSSSPEYKALVNKKY